MIGWALVLCYVLGPPAIALAICLACHRHRVLLWVGGLLAIPLGVLMLLLELSGVIEGTYVVALRWVTLPLLTAGTIVLAGGLVRWDAAWRRGRRAVVSGTSGPTDHPGPGATTGR